MSTGGLSQHRVEAAATGAMGDATIIIEAIQRGERRAAEELIPLVYQELRHLAASRLSHQPPGQTLQATELVHRLLVWKLHLRLCGG